MAKAVGLDSGNFEVKLIELDGSYKRPRITRLAVEPVPEIAPGVSTDDAARADAVAEAALAAFEATRIPKDGFTASFPSREAVMRQLDVPFVGREQIRKVIKFEAEGSIHSHNVDDMVVDFMVLSEHKNESRVMVAAVPKSALRTSLDALQNHGIEPEIVDLDAVALFRAGEWCGAFSGAAGGDAGDEPVETEASLVPADTSDPVRLLLDVGARSTRVLVVTNGKFVDLRTLRTGADAMAEEVATLMGVGLADAREAVEESLRTDEDFVIVGSDESLLAPVIAEDSEEGDEQAAGEAEPQEARTQLIPHSEVNAACDRYLNRLRRELMRFLTSVPSASNVEAVWVTGGASQTPGVMEVIGAVFGHRPQVLDVLANISHKLDTDEARVQGPKLAVAIGLALDTLAGRQGFNFRQEELAFTKGFDRIKFPLAITCMLGLFLALVFALKSWRELRQLGIEYGATYSNEVSETRGRETRTAKFLGYLGSLVNPDGWFASGNYYDKKSYEKLITQLLDTDTFKRLPVLNQELKKYYREQQQKTGYYSDLRLGSGLGTLVQMAEVLKRVEPQLGRYLVTKLTLRLPYKEAARRLSFDLALRSDDISDFRTKWGVVERAFREACASRSSVFAKLRDESGEQATFESPSGNGAMYRVSLDIHGEKNYPRFPSKEQ